MDVTNMYFFSIPSSPFLTLLSVTAKSFADFDPNVVLFNGKSKWLILKWVKFSKAIQCVLDSLICRGRITDILGARFHVCIQNGTSHVHMQTNLTIFDLEKNSGQSLIHYELHIDRTKSEVWTVLSIDTVVWIFSWKMSSINRCQQKEGWKST